MAETVDHDERRAHQRADVRLPARVRSGTTVVEAEAINLSEGGVLLAGAGFPSAAQVKIEIELAELGWQALDAQVVRVTGGDPPALAASFAAAATEGGREAIRTFFRTHLST